MSLKKYVAGRVERLSKWNKACWLCISYLTAIWQFYLENQIKIQPSKNIRKWSNNLWLSWTFTLASYY
jgi:hypothetical protein